MDENLSELPLPTDKVGLLEGLVTTRAVRRYTPEPVPSAALRAMLFAATRAPSGSNLQPFRFLVLTDGPNATQAKELLGKSATQMWDAMRIANGYVRGSGLDPNSRKARMDRSMQEYARSFGAVPVVVLACMIRFGRPTPTEGASIYPACENLLLAARALGFGGVLSELHRRVEPELRSLLHIPDDVFIAATITIGRPRGRHGPVRRQPIKELVFDDDWEATAPWAIDPPGTKFTRAWAPQQAAGST